MNEGLVPARKACPRVRALFAVFPHNQVRVMAGTDGAGTVWVDNRDDPHVAALVFGAGFVVGDPEHAMADVIARSFPPMVDVIPPDAAWKMVLQTAWESRFRRETNWHFSGPIPPAPAIKNDAVQVCAIDGALLEKCKALMPELFSAYVSNRTFLDSAFGFCAFYGDQVIGIANVAVRHETMVDVAIHTDRRFRRQGIARALMTTLLHTCDTRGLTPMWEAINPRSAALATALGFSAPVAYDVCFQRDI